MFITASEHCLDQAELRDLEAELREGLELIWDIDNTDMRGEVNFIIERKDLVLTREGSTGDLVIIGVNIEGRIAKSIFLQNSRQVDTRQSKLDKVYHSCIDWEV